MLKLPGHFLPIGNLCPKINLILGSILNILVLFVIIKWYPKNRLC